MPAMRMSPDELAAAGEVALILLAAHPTHRSPSGHEVAELDQDRPSLDWDAERCRDQQVVVDTAALLEPEHVTLAAEYVAVLVRPSSTRGSGRSISTSNDDEVRTRLYRAVGFGRDERLEMMWRR